MASYEHFAQELRTQMGRATTRGALDVMVCAGELFRSLPLGGHPDLEIGYCCDAMCDELSFGDIVLIPSGNGSGMTVRFMLPRLPRQAILNKANEDTSGFNLGH